MGAQATSELAYPGRIVMRDEVASTLYENICPVALLMNDAGFCTVIIEPRCGRTPREALNASESRVLRSRRRVRMRFDRRLSHSHAYLDDYFRASMRCDGVVVSGIEDYADIMLGQVRSKVRQERYRPRVCVSLGSRGYTISLLTQHL